MGASADEPTSDGFTPLHFASSKGFAALVELLLDYGGIQQSRHCANTINNSSCITTLEHGSNSFDQTTAGVDPNPKEIYGHTPLHMAAENGHANVVKMLLSRGGDPNLQAGDGCTPLHISCQRKNINIQVSELLLRVGADPNVKDNFGQTPLHIVLLDDESTADDDSSSRSNDDRAVELVQLLLVNGAKHCQRDPEGNTPLRSAIDIRFDDVIHVLTKWPFTSLLIVLQHLSIYSSLDFSTLVDLFEFIGEETDYLT